MLKYAMNIKLTIEYDGTNYSGWQRLPDKPTVQGSIENALKKILGETIEVGGAGRTDAGVHAKDQSANFQAKPKIPFNRLRDALNSILPGDINIKKVEKVKDGFSSRFSAKMKTYRYTIYNSSEKDVFLANQALHWSGGKLDIAKMRKAAKYLVGNKDFKVFSYSEISPKTVRTLKAVKITRKGKFIYLDFIGKTFLRRQVRMMTGILIRVGTGRIPPEVIKDIFAKKTGIQPVVAPPQGLCLYKIKY